MSNKFVTVMFPRGAMLPKGVTRDGAACKAGPGEDIEVTEAYGRHVISDRFAESVQVEKSAKKKGGKSASEGTVIKEEADDVGEGAGDGSGEGSGDGEGKDLP
ncbi:hypothetical protein [Pannonibacter sp. P2PFMT1]|uniref:hypothetical protein n=1 Tax=Pannonibacter sp. P2PFMT1 TaxID=2003582 RepID=UPI00164610C0|nr:hypothetical protein [Pannonibacter sp. P2PFMT1]